MVNDLTANLGLPLPHADNSLDVDVGRLRTAVSGLDTAVAGKTAIGHGHAITDVSGLDSALAGKNAYLGFTPVNSAAVGTVNGVAPLDGTGKVAAAYLPSYVDDVLEYANFAALPGTGETGKIYVLVTPYTAGGITSSQFRWSGSAYSAIVASPGTTDAVTEGSTNKYFTESRVLATLLAGLSTATNLAIAAGDSILGAMGKLQKQITDLIATVGTKQAALVSGTNIKTVGGQSLLGSGDVSTGLTLVKVSGATQAASAGSEYYLEGPACAVTAPSPADGACFAVVPANGLGSNTIDFGAATVQCQAGSTTGVVTLDMKFRMEVVYSSTISKWITK